ncbi:MAG: peptidoglycan-binding protein [Xanthomonadales bacterium]|jgi:hypothetical protein|nr:peptidoglycan-binding protein [Xanthomonadales bacterium]
MVSRRLLYLYCESGDDVKDFQDGVNAVRNLPGQSSAFDPLVVDGIFGSNSLKRAREFQNINGLTVDGLVGDGTWGKLLALMHGKGGLTPADRPGGGAGGGQTKGGGKQAFGKPLPNKPESKPGPGKSSGTQWHKPGGGSKSGPDPYGQKAGGGSKGGSDPFGHQAGGGSKNVFDPFGQKTAPGSHKISSW